MVFHSEFLERLEQYGTQEGVNPTALDKVVIVRESQPHAKIRTIYEPFLVIAGQGSKNCYAGEETYEYGTGSGLAVLLPMPVQTEIVGATPEEPFLAAVIALNLDRLSEILLKIEQTDGYPTQPTEEEPSGIFTVPLSEELMQPIMRLFDALESARDTAVLADLIMDEIHYRLLCHEHSGVLRTLLHQRGHIQPVTKAVDYIHQNLDKPISVQDLAKIVNMSRATFYEHFRAVMHMSPLQYAKSMKLFEAQRFIREGKNASEAGYLVGYSSPAQFSREYKRHFGYTPSNTLAIH